MDIFKYKRDPYQIKTSKATIILTIIPFPHSKGLKRMNIPTFVQNILGNIQLLLNSFFILLLYYRIITPVPLSKFIKCAYGETTKTLRSRYE